jgi:hypothetical protein
MVEAGHIGMRNRQSSTNALENTASHKLQELKGRKKTLARRST